VFGAVLSSPALRNSHVPTPPLTEQVRQSAQSKVLSALQVSPQVPPQVPFSMVSRSHVSHWSPLAEQPTNGEHCQVPLHEPKPQAPPSSAEPPGFWQLPLQQKVPGAVQLVPLEPDAATQFPKAPLHALQVVEHSAKSPAERPWHEPLTQCEQSPLQFLPVFAVRFWHAPPPDPHCSQVPHSVVSPSALLSQLPLTQWVHSALQPLPAAEVMPTQSPPATLHC
jgi:hypothetical protein